MALVEEFLSFNRALFCSIESFISRKKTQNTYDEENVKIWNFFYVVGLGAHTIFPRLAHAHNFYF